MKVPLNVDVHCIDGRYGRSTHIIIDPATRKVTHIVVSRQRKVENGRLVPVKWVKETTPDLIFLNCSRQEVTNLDSFMKTDFVRRESREFGSEPSLTLLWPYIESKKRIIEEKRLQIPPDVQVVQQGTRVRATDGLVGEVSEFIVNQESGHITHLVLREGLPWNKKQITIPVSEIAYIEKKTVYLNLKKRQVKELPATPVEQ